MCNRLIIRVCICIRFPPGHRTIRSMICIVRTQFIDRLDITVIHIHFRCPCQLIGGFLLERLHHRGNTFRRIIIIVVHCDNNISACLIIQAITFCTDRLFFRRMYVSQIWDIQALEHISHRIRAIIQNNPLHAICTVFLMLVTFDQIRNESSAIIGGCNHRNKRPRRG